MSKHTPGPWFIWNEKDMKEEGLEPAEINKELLECDYFEIMHGNPIGDGTIKGCNEIVDLDAESFGEDPEEGRRIALANARLIAAAPELLEALISIAEESSDAGARACAMEAIAKATGGTT